MFNSKEKKKQQQEAAEKAKQNAEFEAKLTAKMERKKIEKMIAGTEKTENSLMASAAEAKQKGYAAVYKQQVSMIKVVRARKRQAEMFLYQVNAMEQMRDLAAGSTALLNSMGLIMGSLGKLSVDRTAMLNSQKDFADAQRQLEQQSMNIESFLSSMEMMVPEEESSFDMYADADIDAEIDNFIKNGAAGGGATSASDDADIAKYKSLLGN